MVEAIAERILALHGWVALSVVFLLPALEASAFVGFLFPGEIAVILGGVLAFQGRISLQATLAVAIAGAVVGDTVGYWVGRRWGRRMLDGSLGRFVKARHIDRAERYLADRGGGKAVFFGRFTAALRVMIPGLAGMARMRYRTFLLNNLAGGAVWATIFVLLGYGAGTGWRRVEALAKRASLVLLLLAVVIVGIVLGARWIASHPERFRGLVDRQLSRPLIARIRVRRRRELEFLARRLRPEGALGLSLTVAVLALVAVTIAFSAIVLDVLGARELALVDQPVHELFLAHREAWLTTVMLAVTTLGGGPFLAGLVLVVGLAWRWRGRSWRPLVLLASVQLGALACSWMVKAVVPRVRPADPLVAVGTVGTSFPSAHAVDAGAVYGMLAALVAAALPLWGRKVAVWATAVGLVAVIGLSRLYLGASWFTDVLGGSALGAGWMLLVWTTAQTLVGRRESRRPPPARDEPPLLVPGGPEPDQERDGR